MSAMQTTDKSILTINALHPGSSSGILIDWAILQHMGIHPFIVIAGVILDEENVEAIDASLLRRQLVSFADKAKMDAVKTGLLITRENIETVATFFEDNQHHVNHLVADVMLESAEEMVYLSSTAISLLKMRLLPLAEITVTYLSEAERLSGQPVKTITEMKEAAEAIKIYGPKFVLVKADRRVDDEWIDIFYDGTEHQLLFYKEDPGIDVRRARDIFSSALAVHLAGGASVRDAVLSARDFSVGYRVINRSAMASS